MLWRPDNGAAWIDPARTAIVLYSERARRAHLTCPELAEPVARGPLAYSGWLGGIPRGS
jgi:hypothetical protein